MLQVEGLVKRFGDVVALDGCTFTAQPGRLTGFLGPNGAGKTTAMRAVFGLVHLDAGQVRWNGSPVRPEVWDRFGYMPEERGLYPKMRVGAQIVHFGLLAGMAREEARRAAEMWLERLGLSDRADATVDELSHGNQQRVQLAVALAHDPDLLVLDEPFAGLDPLGVESLGRLLRDLAHEGRTVLFSSHQLDLVEHLCEDVVTIHRGRVVMRGALTALRAAAQQRRVEIDIAGASEGWLPRMPHAEVLERSDGHVRLLVDRTVDVVGLARVAAEAGEVMRFDFDPPTLSDLFREAVQ